MEINAWTDICLVKKVAFTSYLLNDFDKKHSNNT